MSGSRVSDVSSVAQIVSDRVTETFFKKFLGRLHSGDECYGLWIISPWFSALHGEDISLRDIVETVEQNDIKTTIISRPPEFDYHRSAMGEFLRSSPVEVYLNSTLHAKMYIARNRDIPLGLIGSANLSKTGLRGIEVGMLIRGVEWGSELVQSMVHVALSIRDIDTTTQIKQFRRDVDARYKYLM